MAQKRFSETTVRVLYLVGCECLMYRVRVDGLTPKNGFRVQVHGKKRDINEPTVRVLYPVDVNVYGAASWPYPEKRTVP